MKYKDFCNKVCDLIKQNEVTAKVTFGVDDNGRYIARFSTGYTLLSNAYSESITIRTRNHQYQVSVA